MNCKITRRKLVKFGTITMGGDYKEEGQEWRIEECGMSIFGSGQKEVCSSCLKGWTHEHNYMLETKQNKKLLETAKAESGGGSKRKVCNYCLEKTDILPDDFCCQICIDNYK